MSITGNTKAPTYARQNVARLGAFRLNYYRPLTLLITFNGVAVPSSVRIAGLSIRDVLDGEPNIATMRVDGATAPVQGQTVQIGLGSLEPGQLLFGGKIQMVTALYEADNPRNVAWDLTCISWEWLLNRRAIVTRYANMTANAIAADIIARYAEGFTGNGIETNLPVLDEFTLTNESVTGALDRLAKRIGGYWFVDAVRDLKFFASTAWAGSTHPITNSTPNSMSGIVHTIDLDPVRTRAIVEAGGSITINDVAIGDTMIPIDDVVWYPGAPGGVVQIGARILSYTGVDLGLGGAIIGAGVIAPTNAPVPTAAIGAGLATGTFRYKVTYATATGETMAGPASGPVVTGGIVGAPAQPVATRGTAGGNLSAGAYQWLVTFGDATGGETVPSLSSVVIVLGAIPPPTAPTAAIVGTVGNLGAGAYRYVTTFRVGSLETLASPPSVAATVPGVSPPNPPSAAITANTGNLRPGALKYKVTFVASGGETTGSGEFGPIGVSSVPAPTGAITPTLAMGGALTAGHEYKWILTNVTALGETTAGPESASIVMAPIAPPATTLSGMGTTVESPVFGAGGGHLVNASRPFEWAYTFYNASGPYETTMGPSVSWNVNLPQPYFDMYLLKSGVAAPPSGWVRRWYRKQASEAFKIMGGPVEGFSADGGDRWLDYQTRAQCGPAEPPATNTAIRGTANLAFSIANDPNVTSRKLYRANLTAGGGYKLVTTIATGATSYTDAIADASLGAAPPSSSTAGGFGQATVTFGTSVDARVTGRKLYRTVSGGTTFKLLTTINNNTATSFVDNVADASLGADIPSVSTAGTGRMTVDNIAVPTDPAVTARRIYRTTADGAVYKLLATLSDIVTTTYADNTADASLGADAPAVATADYRKATVTLPLSSDPNITKRTLYRTLANGSAFKLAAVIANNVTASVTDDLADAGLGIAPPSSATAVYNRVALTDIPVSPDAAVTLRKVYRTQVNGSVFQLLTTIGNNVTQTYADSTPDGSLGAVEPSGGGSGLTIADGVVQAGATVIPLTSGGPFRSDGGWARVQSQVVRYTGKTSTSITGIPATGIGALAATVRYGNEILPAQMLTGVPATGVNAIGFTVQKGEDVNLRITRDDLPAQAAMAAAVGGDGIHEVFIQDRRLSAVEARLRGDAKLLELKDPIRTVQYQTRDLSARSGRSVSIQLGAPQNIVGTFKIQSVTITQFDARGINRPLRTVTASSRRESLESILRILKKREEY